MRKLAFGIVAAGAVFALSATASAQSSFGDKGSMVLSAERLFGISWYKIDYKPNLPGSVKGKITGRNFSLLWGQPSSGEVQFVSVPVPASIPRASFDYFVINSLSIGGSLGYHSTGGDDDSGYMSEQELDDISSLIFSPRVGYGLSLGTNATAWLRGGFTFMTLSVDSDGGTDVSGSFLQADLESMFVIGIAGNFAFEVGPALEIPLHGELTYDGVDEEGFDLEVDYDIKPMSLGGYGGLVGWF